MPWVVFEPTIPAFERAKTVHALDSAATVIGNFYIPSFLPLGATAQGELWPPEQSASIIILDWLSGFLQFNFYGVSF
jgi:hypothetical protein